MQLATSATGFRQPWTGAALTAGILAGPLFYVTVTAQILTRSGFSIVRDPLSLLSLGQEGWIQATERGRQRATE